MPLNIADQQIANNAHFVRMCAWRDPYDGCNAGLTWVAYVNYGGALRSFLKSYKGVAPLDDDLPTALELGPAKVPNVR
jgi:hypothetical protein